MMARNICLVWIEDSEVNANSELAFYYHHSLYLRPQLSVSNAPTP